jgi:hypothetical protein
VTPAELTALEGLVGRQLTLTELEQIDVWLPPRRDDLIAALLSTGRTRLVSHFASERGILDRYQGPGGPIGADALLSKIEGFALSAHPLAGIVKRAVKFLGQPEGIDLGSQGVQGILQLLTQGGVITAEERAALVAMATQPDPITTNQVSDALNKAQGLMTIGG